MGAEGISGLLDLVVDIENIVTSTSWRLPSKLLERGQIWLDKDRVGERGLKFIKKAPFMIELKRLIFTSFKNISNQCDVTRQQQDIAFLSVCCILNKKDHCQYDDGNCSH